MENSSKSEINRKHVKVSLETWKALTIIKALHNFRTYDQVIQFLIKFYRQHKEKKQETQGEKW